MTRYAQRSQLAAIVHKTIRSRPLGDVVELAHAILDDIEDAGWTIAKADAVPVRNGNPGDAMVARQPRPPIREKRDILPALSRRLVRKPIVVTVPHRLGREEAKRRLVDGLQQVSEQIAAEHASLEYAWKEYRLNFSVAAMRLRLDGHTDVEDEFIRISIHLPFLLRVLADPIASRVESNTELLLREPAI
jgi:hypothetical protein